MKLALAAVLFWGLVLVGVMGGGWIGGPVGVAVGFWFAVIIATLLIVAMFSSKRESD